MGTRYVHHVQTTEKQEFYKDLNKEKDGSIMRSILLSLIDKKLKEDFDIEKACLASLEDSRNNE